MVDTGSKIEQIKKMIFEGRYFTINRARQYGKTTTLNSLENSLYDDYFVASISFQGIGGILFDSEAEFCDAFLGMVSASLNFSTIPKDYIKLWNNSKITNFKLLGTHITEMCKLCLDFGKKIVLFIDEVDKSSDNQIFLHFLGMLREKYLLRERDKDYTFHSVVLAGVYDIKNMKLKMVQEGLITLKTVDERKFNSPWNIAAKFDVDMSFNPLEISTMLNEYEKDHSTGMDIMAISNEIYSYTSGYPFLVSRVCQAIDEELYKNWTIQGIQDAVKIILKEENTLFDDIYKNLENNKLLYNLIYDISVVGVDYPTNFGNPTIKLGHTYGFFKDNNGMVAISNTIFETIIYEYFISIDKTNGSLKKISGIFADDVIINGKFNMELCLEKFAHHYYELFNDSDVVFLEKHGRMLFLSYIRPLINGRGFYHIESETRNLRRMDIVVDYGSQQFIIELKIWRGTEENKNAYQQLIDYMNIKNADTGYLLTFDFRKNKKQQKANWETIDGKQIFDVIV
jgi:hypothetical protein